MAENEKSSSSPPSESSKASRESDPFFFANLGLIFALILIIPLSYYLQPESLRQEYSVRVYTGHVLMASPALFTGEWPSYAGKGMVVRASLAVAAAFGLLVGFFIAVVRNIAIREVRTASQELQDEVQRKVGTLTYTKAGLFIMFFWMLWGDFCYTLMERIFPVIMPLQLKSMGANNTGLLFLRVQLPAVLGFTFAPMIGFHSDRFRSRFGRRIPFIVVTAPLLCLFLVLLGYSGAISDYFHASPIPGRIRISPTFLALVVVGVLIAGFQFFNLFLNAAFWALFSDVIPPAYYARFSAAFGLVGYFAAFVFSTYIFPFAESHTKQIYWGAAMLYLVGFSIMCLFVREGEYPPPDDIVRKKRFEGASIFFRECFTHPFYLALFSFNALWAMTNLVNDLKIFYFLNEVHLSKTEIGAISGIMSLLTLILSYIVGYLIDRTNPLVNMLISVICLIPITIAGAYIFNAYDYLIVSLVTAVATQLWDMAYTPMMLILLPRQRYAQFQGANAMFRSVVNIFGPFAAGFTFDLLSHRGQNIAVYRYVFIWQAAFMIPALVTFVYVMFYWVRHGGSKRFVPPDTTPLDAVGEPRAFEVVM